MRCLVREKDIQIKPEEIVRQLLYLYRLMNDYGYERKSIAVEFPVKFGSSTKKADIVIRDKKHRESAYIIVELKKPNCTTRFPNCSIRQKTNGKAFSMRAVEIAIERDEETAALEMINAEGVI